MQSLKSGVQKCGRALAPRDQRLLERNCSDAAVSIIYNWRSFRSRFLWRYDSFYGVMVLSMVLWFFLWCYGSDAGLRSRR